MVDVQTVMDRLEALQAYLAEMDHYAQCTGALNDEAVR